MINKRRKHDGEPLIYLDNAATTFKPRQVIEAVLSYYEGFTANVHRGIYELSQEVMNLMKSNGEIVKFIGARNASGIVNAR
ncbi:MAG: aminotransferase class V-fold PLP-dependent enzyme [Candidatus Baldrarchaeia archaeon]